MTQAANVIRSQWVKMRDALAWSTIRWRAESAPTQNNYVADLKDMLRLAQLYSAAQKIYPDDGTADFQWFWKDLALDAYGKNLKAADLSAKWGK